MPEYDMPIEEQVKLLVKEFKALKGSMETRFDSVDSRLDSVDSRLDSMDSRFNSMDSRFDTVDGKLDKMQVLLDDTHAIAKLGLEGVQGLRESTDEKFAAAAKTNAEQTGLLKSLVVHIRNRVDRVEQPPKRGRRN